MFLSKRSNGIYYLVYIDSKGKKVRISTKTKTKAEARKFLVQFTKNLNEIEEREIIPIHLSMFIKNFLKHSELVHTKWTTYTYNQTFEFFKGFFGDVVLSLLTQKDISRYIDYRINQSSIYQARKDLINLCASFNWAIAEGYLIKSPCEGIKMIKVPQKLPLFYSENDFQKLLDAITNEDIKDLVIFAVNTGLRQMELIKMQWHQVNIKDRIVILDNQQHITKGKKVRTIPLNQKAFAVIEKRIANSKCSNVFTYKENPLHQDFLSRKFAGYVDKAGINSKLNFHSLRHTFASWLVQKGVSIYKVSKLLGHSDTKTTEIYSHLRAEDLRDSTDLLND